MILFFSNLYPEHSFIVYILFYLVLCGLTVYWAESKGRNPMAWGLLSLLVTPAVGFIGLLIVSDKNDLKERSNEHKELVEIIKSLK